MKEYLLKKKAKEEAEWRFNTYGSRSIFTIEAMKTRQHDFMAGVDHAIFLMKEEMKSSTVQK